MQILGSALGNSLYALAVILSPPLLAIGALMLGVLLRISPDRASSFWSSQFRLPFAHLSFFPMVIAVGVVFPQTATTKGTNEIGSLLLSILGYASLISCAFWIWRMKGFRWFVTFQVAALEIAVVASLFVSGMAVTGDWL